MTLTPEMVKVYASGGVNERWFDTLEFTHASWGIGASFAITNNPFGFRAQGSLGSATQYNPYPFTFALPTPNKDGIQDIEISISSVSREPIELIEQAAPNPTQPMFVTYRSFLENDFQKPGHVIDGLTVTSIVADKTSITARATAGDIINRPFPGMIYRRDMFPLLAAAVS